MVLNGFWKQSSLAATSVTSALEVIFNEMSYINLRFTYLLATSGWLLARALTFPSRIEPYRTFSDSPLEVIINWKITGTDTLRQVPDDCRAAASDTSQRGKTATGVDPRAIRRARTHTHHIVYFINIHKTTAQCRQCFIVWLPLTEPVTYGDAG